jgi:hypothetical protein
MIIGAVLLAGSLASLNGVAMRGDEINPLVREIINVLPQGAPSRPIYTAQVSPLSASSPVHVQVNVNLFIPGPADESDAAAKVRDHARRSIYEMAAHECDLVRDVIAKDCRLQSISVNVMRQQYGNASNGYNVTGNFSLQITLK